MTEQDYLRLLKQIPARAQEKCSPGEQPQELAARQFDMEHELLVDFKLGPEFPVDKRKALLELHRKKVCDHKALTRRLRQRELSPQQFAEEVQVLVRQIVEQLRTLLDERQVEALIGVKAGETPFLPIDPDRIELD